MNKTILFFILTIVTLSLIATVYSQASSSVLTERQGHRNQCYYKSPGKKTKYFDVGKNSYDNKQCLRYTCSKRKGKLYLETLGCGILGGMKPNCAIYKGKGQRHPDCCPKWVCGPDNLWVE